MSRDRLYPPPPEKRICTHPNRPAWAEECDTLVQCGQCKAWFIADWHSGTTPVTWMWRRVSILDFAARRRVRRIQVERTWLEQRDERTPAPPPKGQGRS